MRLSAEEKVEKIREIVNDVNPALEEALKSLCQWIPEDMPLEKVSHIVNGEGMYEGERGEYMKDEDCPFVTEAYTYNLFGKDDARTFLALVRQIVEAAGFNRDHIAQWVDEAYLRRQVENRLQAERLRRIMERKSGKKS